MKKGATRVAPFWVFFREFTWSDQVFLVILINIQASPLGRGVKAVSCSVVSLNCTSLLIM